MGSSTERGDDAREDARNAVIESVGDEVMAGPDAATDVATEAVADTVSDAPSSDPAIGSVEAEVEAPPAAEPVVAAAPQPEPTPADAGQAVESVTPSAGRTPLLDAVAAAGAVNIPTTDPVVVLPMSLGATAPVLARPVVPDLPVADERATASPVVPGQVTRVPTLPGHTSAVASSPAAAAVPAPAPTDPLSRVTQPDAEPAPASSPLDVFEADARRRRWPRVLLTVLSIVVVLGAVYVGGCYAASNTVPRGATVAGIDIGGLGRDAAVTALESGLTKATTEPIAVTAGDITGSVDPASAGLTLDAPATVSRLVGFDLHPVRLWRLLFGVGAEQPVTQVDDAALSSAIDALGGSLTQAPVNGGIVFADGAPHETAAASGWKLDAAAAAATLRTRWLTAARPLTLATVPVAPDITQAETDQAMADVATRLTSAPVTVQVGGQLAELPATVLASVASFVPSSSGLTLQLDGPKLVAAVLARTTNLLTASADAHFEFQNDAPVIVPGQAGTTLDPAGLASAVAAAAVASQRTATVQLVQADPAQSTEKLQALGVKEIVSEFATPLTSEPRRTVNITNGAKNINGTVVLPGATFSLTDALGPITAANGYIDAGVLIGDEHTQGIGGGLSQVSTTTYNAAYFAGYVDVEHHPHTEWFSRYPEGRESTIYTGTLDLRWKNNTPYGALVQAWVANNQVHVRIWSTKYWTVTSSTSARSRVVQPTTVYSQSPTCVPSSAGNPGFRVSVTRTVSLNGTVEETKTFTTTYQPQNTIVCGPAPTPPGG
jgi:vancomycin resistance protein YoaR